MRIRPLLKNLANCRWCFWVLISVPAIPLIADFYLDQRYYAELMYKSGVLSTQFLVICMIITPLRKLVSVIGLFNYDVTRTIFRWLLIQRRYLGVAAFGYGLIHTLFYIRQLADLDQILAEFLQYELFIGWVAMIIFLLLTVTANNYSLRALGKTWKSLHRWTYPAALLVFLHWYWFDFRYDQIFIWFIPLLLLQLIRMGLSRSAKPLRLFPLLKKSR